MCIFWNSDVSILSRPTDADIILLSKRDHSVEYKQIWHPPLTASVNAPCSRQRHCGIYETLI